MARTVDEDCGHEWSFAFSHVAVRTIVKIVDFVDEILRRKHHLVLVVVVIQEIAVGIQKSHHFVVVVVVVHVVVMVFPLASIQQCHCPIDPSRSPFHFLLDFHQWNQWRKWIPNYRHEYDTDAWEEEEAAEEEVHLVVAVVAEVELRGNRYSMFDLSVHLVARNDATAVSVWHDPIVVFC